MHGAAAAFSAHAVAEQSVVTLWGAEGEEERDLLPALRALLPQLHRGGSSAVGLARRCSTAPAFLAEASRVADRLADLVRPSYGPDGALRATVDMTGQVGFTAHGARLLRKGRGDHPIARCLLSSLAGWERRAADGSARWMLLCAAVLRSLAGAPAPLHGRPLALAAARAASTACSSARDAAAARARPLSAPAAVAAAARGVISTCCSEDAGDLLCGLVEQLAAAFGPDLTTLLADPHGWVVGVAGGSLRQSRVLRGRPLRAICRTPRLRPEVTAASKVAVLRRALLPRLPREEAAGDPSAESDTSSDGDGCGGAFGAPVSLEGGAEVLQAARRWAESRCAAFAERLKRAGVVLLVAQGALPDEAIGALLAQRITVFDTVSPSEARKLAEALGVVPVDPWDTAQQGCWAGELQGAEAVRGNPELLCVAGAQGAAAGHTLVVMNPSPGLAEEYARLAARALAHAAWALGGCGAADGAPADRPGSAGWVAGAGADLLAAAAAVRGRAGAPAGDSDVPEGLEEVAAAGAANTLRSAHAARRLVADALRGGAHDGATGLVSTLRCAAALSGPSAVELCELRDAAALGILEPAGLAPELLRSVLTAAAALCRVDGIAAARRAPGSAHVDCTPFV
eukprot:TRINITY_DN25024_c0_g1_i2.p1 TRINITY_DN25024_c0_g1~~TRINITY_DN25024_c0_g1_i2.p1  ORF type:complete len:653 (+),score=169.14 TRINITY_DN25024_c0_g1_i2:75-1961(+)